MMQDAEFLISSNDNYYWLDALEDAEWSTERIGVPGKLTFKAVEEPGKSKITEGDPIRFRYKGKNVFYGFVFSRKISDGVVTVTAYDQLRYLKNKDTYVYKDKTLTEVVKMIAKDKDLSVGALADTKYKIASRVEDDQTLFDIIANAQDLTLMAKNKMYVLYDDFGKLRLKDIADMVVGIVIDAETGQGQDYSSSIDSDVYNQVKLYFDNEETGKRELYIAKSTKNINKWGLLQLYEKLEKGENGKEKANALLSLYNTKKQSLGITKAVGDQRVRAGSMVVVSLKVDGKDMYSYMLVSKCKHIYGNNEHWMDLTLTGGGFSE